MSVVIRLLIVSCALPLLAKPQAATFSITYNSGFTPQSQAAFEYAANRWSQILQSDVPIKVNANLLPLLPGMLGITFPNGRKNFSGAPMTDTWYATSLANSLAGFELNPGEADIDIFLNQSIGWFYDSVGTVSASQYDFVSVVMHELGHGFGFVSLAKKTGTEGSFGMLESVDFAPLTPSFPWPDLDTLPGAYDRFLVNVTNESLLDFSNPGTALGSALTNNNVYFNGPNAIAANSGAKPRVFAPASFSLGSSISHFNEATFPTGNANEMMTPYGAPGNANHNPGPLALGVLRDIGWNLNPSLSVYDDLIQHTFLVYPNPADKRLLLNCDELIDVSVNIVDATGREILEVIKFNCSDAIDVSMLTPGFYHAIVVSRSATHRARLVKL